MPCNLNDRVELFFPVETEEHIKRIKSILQLYLEDNVGAHMMSKRQLPESRARKGKEIAPRACFTNMFPAGSGGKIWKRFPWSNGFVRRRGRKT